MPDQSHSPAAISALTGNSVGMISKGGSPDASGAQPEAPVCRHTTVSVSSQAARRGSHVPLKIDGSPSRAGNSGKLTALKPRAALARTSAAATSTSANHGSCSGMMRSGCAPAHSSMCQSLNARRQASPSSASFAREYTAPQNPDTSEGKHRAAQMPPRSMSTIRASMSKQPGRISSKRAGSMLHSFFGRPTTVFSPMLG